MTWQPIETMPKRGACFVWDDMGGTILLREAWEATEDYDADEVFSEIGTGGGEVFGEFSFTHWMPLPEPPEAA